MNANPNLTELVRRLDAETLNELRRSIDSEMEERQEASSFQIEEIHPGMSADDWQRAASEIARALKSRY